MKKIFKLSVFSFLILASTHFIFNVPPAKIAEASFFGGTRVPSGVIVMWSGTIATIPATWELADGTCAITCPDLRNRMIVAADADSGGAAKTTVEGAASQTGGAATHTNTLDELVPHRHELFAVHGGGNAAEGTSNYLADVDRSDGVQDQHMTLGSELTGTGTAYSIMNPYYALAYIIKD